MKIRYCWRCRMNITMLDSEEGKIASRLLSEGFQEARKLRKAPNYSKLLDYY